MSNKGFNIEFTEDGLWLDKDIRITKEGGRYKVTVFTEKADLRIMGLNSLKCKNCGALVYGPQEGSGDGDRHRSNKKDEQLHGP